MVPSKVTPAHLAAARRATDAAGTVAKTYFRTRPEADDKPDLSPVTVADRQAERAMRAILEGADGSIGLLGEEFPAVRDDAALCWVIDPIDGTRAFITGRPTFGILVALVDRAADFAPLLGIVDQPVSGERWTGISGQQTQFSGGRGTVGTRPCVSLADAELSCTTPDMFRGDFSQRFTELRGAVKRVTWGGDCYSYGLLALGQIDVIAEANMQVWDWAALVPVVTGAGGVMTDWDGNTLQPGEDRGVLAVGDPALLPAVVAALRA